EANVVVLTKADSASSEVAREAERLVREWNASCAIVLADLAVGAQPVNTLGDARVVVVEDAPSLLLGGLSGGAGTLAAKRFRCQVIDPRPHAVGAIARALNEHPHIGPVLPALGRSGAEIADLAASVYATPGNVVLWASNADPSQIIEGEQRPIV